MGHVGDLPHAAGTATLSAGPGATPVVPGAAFADVTLEPIELPPLNSAEQSATRTVISHAHARALAECWQDTARETHPITLLARTGEITHDAEGSVSYDLHLLEMAAAAWGSPPSIPEKQLGVLLDYVRYHGPRGPLDGWRQLRDAEFLRGVQRMASEARAQVHGGDSRDEPAYMAPVTQVDDYRARRW